jgi:type VI secretion system protein ImpJ
MINSLSRVSWAMGQALLPGHLRSLEDALLADSALRFNLSETPDYGLYCLRWNQDLLVDGILSLQEMTLVLSSGLLLKLKANAQIASLKLNIPGTSFLSVYLHVRNNSDYMGERVESTNTTRRGDVSCWLWQLELSIYQDNPDTLDSFHLVDFEKKPDGSWCLSSGYIPPLVCFGSVPFLKDELASLVVKLETYHYQLTQEVAAIYLSGADLFNTRECLKSVVNIQRFLANILQQISPHPYTLYEKLKAFYIDLCFYHNYTPQYGSVPYRHEQLAEVFREIFEPLNEQLTFNKTRSPYLPFTISDGLISATLPEVIRKAKEFYLLVQKGGINKTISLDGLKFACVTRIPIVHKFFLQGIPLKSIEKPPFQHSFGPEVDIYQIIVGEEWDFALNELTVGFIPDTRITDEKFFLNWRSD